MSRPKASWVGEVYNRIFGSLKMDHLQVGGREHIGHGLMDPLQDCIGPLDSSQSLAWSGYRRTLTAYLYAAATAAAARAHV